MVQSKHTRTSLHRKTPLSPGGPTATRADRARSEPMAVEPLGGGRYDVVTHDDHVYTVTLPESRCTCPDSKYRGENCKHIRRVAIDVTERRVPAPGQEETPCADCGAATFTPEDDDTLAYCPRCTLRPGTYVRDRERGDVLVVRDTTSERADETAIPGADHTVASYPTNGEYAANDVVVDVLYPLGSDVDPADLDARRLRSYAFPRGRLERLD
ncbi:SWIM zinc finger family protein [Halocalculus aciditolerans]|uniref:SWIM-type domain-containing protein n=1 Tax=Halocalculus aciditolerans TaxID=1383812 RepID=A0A830F1N4_9EURY|nr:SWIM zinc finger family protein [Halocalculus aciditolerans]GGL46333.1 hypothetical protein GCM10009039_00920 [Halocalculus aciditolerans]